MPEDKQSFFTLIFESKLFTLTDNFGYYACSSVLIAGATLSASYYYLPHKKKKATFYYFKIVFLSYFPKFNVSEKSIFIKCTVTKQLINKQIKKG